MHVDAAIHEDALAGDEAGIVRGKKNDYGHDIANFARALQGGEGGETLAHPFG